MHKLKLWLKPFEIIATCPTGGLIETVPDSISINQLKKQNSHIQTLRQYFISSFKDTTKSTQMDKFSTPKFNVTGGKQTPFS
jgi:phosphatidylinositol 4-kinase B